MEQAVNGQGGEDRREGQRREQQRQDSPERRAGFGAGDSVESPESFTPIIEVEQNPDDLRLGNFFSPRLWVAALIPLAFVEITTFMSSVRVSDSLLSAGQVFEDIYFTAPDIGLLGRHLLPFGVPTVTSVIYGNNYSSFLHTNMVLGIVSMFIGMLLVVAATRRSSDGVYLTGPYFVYSMGVIALLFAGAKHYQSLTDVFPALLASLLAPICVGMAVKLFAVWMRNIGWLEVDDYVPQAEELLASQPVAEPQVGAVDAPAVLTGVHVSKAVACPFCGNPKVNHEHAGTCSRCHSNISLHLELPDSPHCRECDGILVREAAFCHHCGKWQKGLEADDGLELAAS
jgi:hypothetical protein